MNTEEAATVLQIASTLDESEDKNLMAVATILRGMLGEIQRLGTESDKLRADLAAKDAEIEALRSELESTRKGWKELAEAPHKHQGMMVSLRGFVLRVSEYLDRKDQGGDAFVLREIQRNLCEVWNRRGDPRIVAEFGALYRLDKDGPIEEVEGDDDKGDES